MTAERDPGKHGVARRLLNPSFSATALKSREHAIHAYTDQFVLQLKS
jgi:cytochrome P450